MEINYLNKLILETKIDEFKKDKNALKFAEWVSENITPEYLDAPKIDMRGMDEKHRLK